MSLIAILVIIPVGGVIAMMSFPSSGFVHDRASFNHDEVFNWLVCWEQLPSEIASADATRTSYSNVHRKDYVTPKGCRECHQEQFEAWTDHPHARMNATANAQTVVGQFDGSTIEFDGGKATMFFKDRQFWIRTEKDEIQRLYRVTRTIGSRFYQYYVGVLESGHPLDVDVLTPKQGWHNQPHQQNVDGDYPDEELVMPVGYWMTKQIWVPAYDVFDCIDDESNPNPMRFDAFDNFEPKPYYRNCGLCHTTQPEDQRLLWDYTATYTPKPTTHVDLWSVLRESTGNKALRPEIQGEWLYDVVGAHLDRYDADEAVTLGISCEACHFGGREHVSTEGNPSPRFVACSPHLSQPGRNKNVLGREAENVNHLCGRCHSAFRHELPGGEMHKNSAEWVDAQRGSCYSQLKCTHCHDPHQKTGLSWPKTAEQDDQSCISCHQPFLDTAVVVAHTHHPVGSEGSRCMNCHMPRVVEGLQDVVRTHRIDSPTRPALIQGAGINACNTCHLDQPIDWTIDQLEKWYGKKFDRQRLTAPYGKQRSLPMGQVWLTHRDPHVRLSAMGSVKQQRAQWLLPWVAMELHNPKLINRQFAQDTIESVLDWDLGSVADYSFWNEPSDRPKKIRMIVDQLTHRQGAQRKTSKQSATSSAQP